MAPNNAINGTSTGSRNGDMHDGSRSTTASATPGRDESNSNNNNNNPPMQPNSNNSNKGYHGKMWSFVAFLALDIAFSVLILFPGILPSLKSPLGLTESRHVYTVYASFLDLAIFACLRLVASFVALLVSFWRARGMPPEYPHTFSLTHPNGERKSREELEQEALEEDMMPWLRRFVTRPSFATEVLALVTQVACVVKCLVRMNIELGLYHSHHAMHPLFWFVILITAILSVVEATLLESTCNLASVFGQQYFYSSSRSVECVASNIRTSSLETPLLDESNNLSSNEAINDEETARTLGNDATSNNNELNLGETEQEARGVSDIGPDTEYKAKWKDLVMACAPDVHLICLAFVFLLLAAIAQVYIPRFLGKILDSLTATFGGDNQKNRRNYDESMFQVPGFMENIRYLVAASVAAGVFSGLRGSIFTIVGGRVNVRLRTHLMDSLLSQDIGFFDVTKTGEITSRLSSDTTLVGDQVALNVNVFLRSLVQAIGVLLFMFLCSWQLSILAFLSVPIITMLSRWYGQYLRKLTKSMQKKLADGSSVSEAALGSMATVRAFDAAEAELQDFESHMANYLRLNDRCAIMYFGYAAMTTAVPELIFAIVVFYGGMLVRNGDLTGGELVSFLLYLQSLSDAFSTIGYVFSSLTQAVGAADKVFELMHRKPKYKHPSTRGAAEEHTEPGVLGIEAKKVRLLRTTGQRLPATETSGRVQLDSVKFYYPARPQRCILDGLSLVVEPGSVVALVGKSGGGKSSVMSLIQHLYEPSNGRVLLDGIDVHNIAPQCLSRAVSIVSQEPSLFARSIKRNIIYGLEGTDTEPSQHDIEKAAKLANAHDFIMTMPQQYDTEVGERGVQLSGGQKQRIAIARALVRKPKVLLLDEATSARLSLILDAESEHLVQAAIDDMIARGKATKDSMGMTVIIVAHRLSTVRNADKIFVVSEGRVVEEGSHAELLVYNGAYASLIQRQMRAHDMLENGATTTSRPVGEAGEATTALPHGLS